MSDCLFFFFHLLIINKSNVINLHGNYDGKRRKAFNKNSQRHVAMHQRRQWDYRSHLKRLNRFLLKIMAGFLWYWYYLFLLHLSCPFAISRLSSDINSVSNGTRGLNNDYEGWLLGWATGSLGDQVGLISLKYELWTKTSRGFESDSSSRRSFEGQIDNEE